MAKAIVKCPRCTVSFDRNDTTIDAVKEKNRWWHRSCLEEKVEDDKRKIEEKLMAQGSDEQRKELYKYICQLFGLVSPGPRNITMINTYYQKFGYTYSGIKKALTYHFEVCKGSLKKAEERIGIVPYVYDEAMDYYKKLENKKQRLAEQASQLSQEVVVIKVAPRPKRAIKEIDINSIE